jgi:SWI/SNF-related matrix-associated actin-dependent regulator 1 of chromatin subfamily A
MTPFERNLAESAKTILRPFILRRLKKDVLLTLPAKFVNEVSVTMTVSQKQKYSDCSQLTSDAAGDEIADDRRKIACHPLLLRYFFTDDALMKIAGVLANDKKYKNDNIKEIFDDIAPLSDFKVHELGIKYPSVKYLVELPSEIVCDSGKFQFLETLLPKLKADGHRVVIFSQLTTLLDVLEMFLNLKELQFLRIDGHTPVKNRQSIINKFQTDNNVFIFLLSTKAGGLGINLTGADTVITHDIAPNPFSDKQAEDRCHRLGQTKEVIVYRLISAGTREEATNRSAAGKLRLELDVTAETDSTRIKNELHEFFLNKLCAAIEPKQAA